MQSNATSSSRVSLPSAYPLRVEASLGKVLAGGSILLCLGAIALLWPVLAATGPCTDGAGLWGMVKDAVGTFSR